MQPEHGHTLAIQGWNMLSNGMGSIDWQGLDTVVALLGVTDVEAFIHRLMTIKHHNPASDKSEPKGEDGHGTGDTLG